jgi:hypothetical protein
MRRVPVSEQMNWMMNLEDLQEGLLGDGGEVDPTAEIVEEGEEIQAAVDQNPVDESNDNEQVLDKEDEKGSEISEPEQDGLSVEENSEGDENEDPSSEDEESKEK